MLIHKAVTKDIADLLSYSNKSIKEIMVELDFPSLSFFGKYVKKHFGVGPKEYRSKRLS
jgi:AraC-like DNA-binding protein